MDYLKNKKKYKPIQSYSQSKQAEILFTFELADRLRSKNISVNSFYPGLVKTNLGRVNSGFRKYTYNFFTTVLKFIFVPMDKVIKVILYILCSEKLKNYSGKYFKVVKNKLIVISKYDREMASSVWNLAKDNTNV